MKKELLLPSVVLTIVFGVVGLVAAQSGTRNVPSSNNRTQGSDTRQAPRSSPQVQRPFEDRLWDYLLQAKYRNWAPLPGQTSAAYKGQSPHGARVKLYANRTAAGWPLEFPNGSVLVKENYDESGTNLMAVTVMYRSKTFAPESGGWYWAKYEPNGAVSAMNGRRVAGRVNMCIECHRSAGGDDYVFANDR